MSSPVLIEVVDGAFPEVDLRGVDLRPEPPDTEVDGDDVRVGELASETVFLARRGVLKDGLRRGLNPVADLLDEVDAEEDFD